MNKFKLFSHSSNYIVPLSHMILKYAVVYEYIIAIYQDDLQSLMHPLALNISEKINFVLLAKQSLSPNLRLVSIRATDFGCKIVHIMVSTILKPLVSL